VLVNILCFVAGMFFMYISSWIISLGHSINILRQVQRSCAELFIQGEEGLHQIFHLKYIAMEEAKKSEQNIITQKYIDQLNLNSIKSSIMRNYIGVFPAKYAHILEYSSWEELEDYVNKLVQTNKEAG
jgi:hypothetical protein